MLKKIFVIGLSFFTLLLLYWCGVKGWFQYEFGNFSWNFDTEKSFVENEKSLDWLGYKLLSNNIVKMYVEDNDDTMFRESIIVTKKNSDKSVEAFWKENLEDVDILWLKMSKWKKIEVKCDETYNLLYYQWRYDMNQYDLYLTYWFLKVNNEIYIISYATMDEKSRNSFSSSLRTLVCK